MSTDETDDPLLRGAVSFVYRSLLNDPTLAAFFERNEAAFVTQGGGNGSSGGDGGSADGEHSLEHMVIYREYEQIVEGLLEEHAASEGFDSAAAFVEAVRAATVRPAAGQGQGEVQARAEHMLQLLLAAAEFDKFAALMRFRARNASRKVHHGAGGSEGGGGVGAKGDKGDKGDAKNAKVGAKGVGGGRAESKAAEHKDADGDAGADGHELSCAALYVDDNEDSDSG